jgi:hypothetical protein
MKIVFLFYKHSLKVKWNNLLFSKPPNPPNMFRPLCGPHRWYLGPYIYTWATRFLNLGAQMATAYKS